MSDLTIIGGGFAGVWAAMSAAAERHRCGNEKIEITLINQDPYLVIRPRLYETQSEDLRVSLIPLLAEIGVELIIGEAENIQAENNIVQLKNSPDVKFDRLVLATGSQLVPPPVKGIEYSFNVDNWAAADKLEKHYQQLAEDETFIVIGASFTGLEIATGLRCRFGSAVRIVLIDQNRSATLQLGKNPTPFIEDALVQAQIETRFGQRVESISANGIMLNSGENILSQTVILASGLQASALTRSIAGTRDTLGRLAVDPVLKVIGSSSIYAAGDTSVAFTDGVNKTLMSCQHAIQMGRFAGHNAVCDLLHEEGITYRQERYATCLDLGSWGAVFTEGWDRQVQAIKQEAKAIKKQIVTEWIYPPRPEIGADAIFEQISLNAADGIAAE